MVKTLNATSDPKDDRRWLKRLEVAALIILLPLAAYLWAAPILAERALTRASLNELVGASHQHPDNPRIFYHLGVRYRQVGNLQQAAQAFAQAAKLGADDEATWLAWANTTRDLDRDDDTYNILTLFLKAHPRSAPAHYALALNYHQNQAYKRAWEEATEATKCDPQNVDAWRLAGEEAMTWGSPADAKSELLRAVALKPGDWRNQMDYGNVLVGLKQNDAALAAYREAVRLAPGEALAQYFLGRALMTHAQTATEIDAARQPLQKAVALRPDLAPAFLLLGQSYSRQAHWPEAQDALRQAEQLAPNDADVAFALAEVYRHLGNAAEASHEAQRHHLLKDYNTQKFALVSRIQVKPDDVDARLELAGLCAAHGETRDASYYYRSVLNRAPDSTAARQGLAALEKASSNGASASTQPAVSTPAALLNEPAIPTPAANATAPTMVSIPTLIADADARRKSNDLEGAKKAYLAVIERDRNVARAYEGVGLILNTQDKPEDAYMFLEHAAKLDSALPATQFVLSQRYREVGFPEEAARRMGRVVKEVADNPEYWYELGKDYGDTESEKAEEAYQHAVTLAPDNAAYLLDLAERQADNGHSTGAEQSYRRALALAPQSSDAASRLAGFLLNGHSAASSEPEAEGLLRRAIALDPHNNFAVFGLGQLELKRNRPKQAISYFLRVVTDNPDIADAWYALSRAYERLGDHKRAAAAIANSRALRQDFLDRLHTEELIRTHAGNATLHRNLARLCGKKGEAARAILEYQLCLKLDPHDTATRKELDRFMAFLKANGRMPVMSLYNIMVSDMAVKPD